MVHRPHSFQNEGKLRALDVFNPLSAGILHHLVPSQQPVFVFFLEEGGRGGRGEDVTSRETINALTIPPRSTQEELIRGQIFLTVFS